MCKFNVTSIGGKDKLKKAAKCLCCSVNLTIVANLSAEVAHSLNDSAPETKSFTFIKHSMSSLNEY